MKYGFTLVELIISITLILIISTIFIFVFPHESDSALESYILESSNMYVSIEEYYGKCLPIKTLINEGYLDENKYDLYSDKYIRIFNDDNVKKYEITDDCDNKFIINLANNYDDSAIDKIYLEYGVGWYLNKSDEEIITKISIPNRNGYEFMGYYLDNETFSEMIIDREGNIQNHKAELFLGDATIYAYWIPKRYKIKVCNYDIYVNVGTSSTISSYYPSCLYVSGDNTIYSDMYIYKGEMPYSSISVKIGFKSNFKGYSSSARDKNCTYKNELYDSKGNIINYYQDSNSCITRSGKEYNISNFVNKTYFFDSNGLIRLRHKLSLSNTIGSGNSYSISELYITIN